MGPVALLAGGLFPSLVRAVGVENVGPRYADGDRRPRWSRLRRVGDVEDFLLLCGDRPLWVGAAPAPVRHLLQEWIESDLVAWIGKVAEG
jgi:hypothetical protein